MKGALLWYMDTVPKAIRSKIMSKIRSKHTKPELQFRRLLQKNRIKYRLHYGKEKIDLAIPSRKIAIFIDGCFWHQCPWHSHIPQSNKKYWIPKLQRNKLRKKKKDQRLKRTGWKAIHIWEHKLKNPEKLEKKLEKSIF